MPADLNIVCYDHDPDRLDEYWLMDGNTPIAKFYSIEHASRTMRILQDDSAYTSSKIAEAKNAKSSAIRAAVESAVRKVGA